MKSKAILNNLIISQGLIISALIFLCWLWFPFSLAGIMGFYHTSLLICLVNFCLGPLLIFFIFKKDKKGLKTDLNILKIIQLSAFIFGIYVVYLNHPVYTVFYKGGFTIISAKDTEPTNIFTTNKIDKLFGKGAKLIFVKEQVVSKETIQIMIEIDKLGAKDFNKREEYFSNYKDHTENILKYELKNKNKFTNAYNKIEKNKFKDYAVFPLSYNNKRYTLALDSLSAIPIKVLNIEPKDPIKLTNYLNYIKPKT